MVTKQYILNGNDFVTYEDLSDIALYLHNLVEISLEDEPKKNYVCYDSLEIKGLNVDVAKELAKFGYHVYYQNYIDNHKNSAFGVILINTNRNTFYSNIGSLVVDTYPLGYEAEEYLDSFEDEDYYYGIEPDFDVFLPLPFSDEELVLMILRTIVFMYIYSRLSSEDYDILDIETLIFLEELLSDKSEYILDYAYSLDLLFWVY